MAFTLRRVTPLPPERAFAALADMASHAAYVPLTTIRTDPGPPRLGWGFVARTALGPVHFDDAMLLTELDAPHTYRLVKTGRLLGGWAQVTVEAAGAGSLVTWTEELWLRGPLAALTRPVGDLLGPRLFGRVVDALLGGAA